MFTAINTKKKEYRKKAFNFYLSSSFSSLENEIVFYYAKRCKMLLLLCLHLH